MTSAARPATTAANPLDRHLATYHFRERHSTTIAASPEAVYRAIRELTPAEMPLVGALFWLRTLPGRVLRRRFRSGRSLPPATPILEAIQSSGFVILEEQAGSHIAVGTIGRFWQASGGTVRLPDAATFHAFSDPSYARAAMDFRILPSRRNPHQVCLTTETRIRTPSSAVRRRFALYWRLIYPGSALIRLLWLRAIKRRAESRY